MAANHQYAERVRGVPLYTLNDWRKAVGLEGKPVLAPELVARLARRLAPKCSVAIDGSLRRLAGYTNLELQSPRDERFHRVYRGIHPIRQDRVVLHLYDLSATEERNAEKKARREFEALHRVQRYPWAPRILDSFQAAPGYAGEMFFFTVVDPAAPTLEDRAADRNWDTEARLAFACGALSALAELHAGGTEGEPLVHRNLTPRTILVRHDNTPVFTGFQYTKIPASASVAPPGPPSEPDEAVVAPEVRQQGLGAADQRSDVYSLCTCLEILFKGQAGNESQQALEIQALEILEKGKTEDPEYRSPVKELEAELRQLLGGGAPRVPPPPARYWTEEQTIEFNGRQYRISENPEVPAHLAIAFDTFVSHVVPEASGAESSRPFYAYGLLSFLERTYRGVPWPVWRGVIPRSSEGQKHPSDRSHTERLMRLQEAVYRCTARNLQPEASRPVLRTEISPEKADNLRTIHRLCDWVITLDRNAGVEYFDSPRDHREVYDAYVIDCVPEREDLGCLQLITSTASLDEVRNLLDEALDQMGLSHSRRNAEFLMKHLKALSGRLAIRLTGQTTATSELVALAIAYANCLRAAEESDGWLCLRSGFLLPADDVRDLIPPVGNEANGHGLTGYRPDLIYVFLQPRRGLGFRFIEVKYRRHLRAARSPELLEGIRKQVESLRERWDQWYSPTEGCALF